MDIEKTILGLLKIAKTLVSEQLGDELDEVEGKDVKAKSVIAITFPSQEAMDTYLKQHPGADKSLHRVEKNDHLHKALKTADHLNKVHGGEHALAVTKQNKDQAKKKQDYDGYRQHHMVEDLLTRHNSRPNSKGDKGENAVSRHFFNHNLSDKNKEPRVSDDPAMHS